MSPKPRLVLVNPPNQRQDLLELAPPLGLLVIAELAQDLGWDPVIVDLSLPRFVDIAEEPESFYARAANLILEHSPDVVGLTSMGLNSHVALLLARQLKSLDADLTILLGGIHFTSIALDLLQMYPWVDFVIAGEGEGPFAQLLRELSPSGRPRTTGDVHARVIRQANADTPIRHPHRAYSLVPLHEYFDANPRRVANYEGGRGCVFKCAFCYSPAHYSSARDVPPATLLSDWARLAGLGFRHVFMVQDNFTNNPRHALEVCNDLREAGLPLTWNGYATLPQLSSRLIEAIGASGCRALYLGIDAVSPTQRVAFNKRFYRGEDQRLKDVLVALRDNGVMPTCAFILNAFSFDPEEAEYVFRVAATCAALGVPIRINTFTRYPGSALAQSRTPQMRPSEAKPRVMLDCPEVVCRNELAIERPDLFPFHATEIAEDVWEYRLRMIRTAQCL